MKIMIPMKRLVLFTMAMLIGLGTASFAQDPDTSKVRIGNKKYTIIVDDDKEIRIITDEDVTIDAPVVKHKVHKKKKHKMNGTWDGFEFGIANFVNSDYAMEMPAGADFLTPKMPNSWTLNFNFAEKSLGLIYNYVGVVTGLGFEYTRYMLENDVKLAEVDDMIVGQPVDMDLDKNRFSMTYLNVPLLAEFQVPVYGERNRVRVSGGVIGGVRLGSRQVQKFMDNGEKQKIKAKDPYGLRTFRYGFTARVGYGDFALFANYYPQPLFEDGMGPDIYPVTVGIHIGGE